MELRSWQSTTWSRSAVPSDPWTQNYQKTSGETFLVDGGSIAQRSWSNWCKNSVYLLKKNIREFYVFLWFNFSDCDFGQQDMMKKRTTVPRHGWRSLRHGIDWVPECQSTFNIHKSGNGSKLGTKRITFFFLFQMENLRSFKPSVFDCLFFKQSTHGVTKFGKSVRVGCLKKGLPFQLLSWRKLFSHPRPPSESPTHVEAKQQDTRFEKTSCTR